MEQVTQADRDAAWPHRYQGAYAENDKTSWMSGRYDGSDIIQAFAQHRKEATAELVEALELWLAYDRDEDSIGVGMMLAYNNALTATKAALAKVQS